MAQTVLIKVSEGRIRVNAPFAYKDALKGLPGARWQPNTPPAKGGWWTFPATATAADSVHGLFSGAVAVSVQSDEAFQGLMVSASAIIDAQSKKGAQELPAIPVSKTEAWLHQKQAFWFTKNMPAALLDMGMGTGKTKVVCDLVVNRGHMKTLVLCPKKVIPTWKDQMSVHGGKPVKVVLIRETDGTVEQKVAKARMALAICEAANVPVVIVINYESAWRSPFGPTYEIRGEGDKKKSVMVAKGFALSAGFDLVVMDESHKIKAPGGRTSKFCANFPQAIPFRLALTGTPMSHGPLDVYAQFRALDPAVFGTSFAKFRDKYAIMGGFENREILGYQNQEEFASKMARLTYHVTEDILELPPARHQTVYATLSSAARKIYSRLEKDFFATLTGVSEELEGAEVSADNVLVKMLRCQQITSGFVTDDDRTEREVDSSKRDLLDETFADLIEAKEKHIVVFCKFTHDLNVVHDLARKHNLSSGEISGRRDDLESFKAGELNVVAVQIQAGGAGVDLTRADVAIYYSVGHNLGDYLQSLRRLDRPTFDGRKRSVLNIHLLVEGSIDEDVYASLSCKEEVIKGVNKRLKERQKVEETMLAVA
jgi:SNF2 family DNA or RNA helicase